jgi:nitrite reductase (cytochrome c-552)
MIGRKRILLIGAVAAALAVGMVALLVNIFERKQEAARPFFPVVQLTEETEDPAVWGRNFPLQYEGYRRTVDQQRTRYGARRLSPGRPPRSTPGR